MTDPAQQATFVREWARTVVGTSYVGLEPAEVEHLLAVQTQRLVAALFAEPFTPVPAGEVAAALVAAHFTGTETLTRTVGLLPRLLVALGEEEPALRDRLSALQGELAGAYARALRDRTLNEQESIRRAALAARTQAERAQRASEARLRAVFTGAAIAIAIGDFDGRILEANHSLADMLGYSLTELHERSVAEFLHPDDADSIQEILSELVLSGRDHVRTERRFVRRDGGLIWARLALSVVRDEDGKPSYLVAMGEDITDRRRLQMRLYHEARHDPLTKLPNRVLLSERLRSALTNSATNARVGLCHLDVDGFRPVNETLGHEIGDRLLVGVSDGLDQVVSPTPHLLAHIGGDEFVVLVRDSSGPEQLVVLADALLAALNAPIEIAGRQLRVNASVGIVERAAAGSAPTELLRAADVALSRAKVEGKNNWVMFDFHRDT